MARALSAFQPLGRGEAALIEALAQGSLVRLGDGRRPTTADPDRLVRAALLRFLVLGAGDAPPVPEKGLRVSGAWITGTLDLDGCRLDRDVAFLDCHFDAVALMRAASIAAVFLDGSTLPGLAADRLEATSGLYLRSSTVTGAFTLPGARLAGELVVDGATLTVTDGVALDAERLRAGGGLLMRGAKVRGGVRLPGAQLGADLNVLGATIDRPLGQALDGDGLGVRGDVVLRLAQVTGGVSFVGARIGGDVDLNGGRFTAPGAMAISLKRAGVEGALFLREGAVVDGALSLNGASLGAIVDNPASWPGPGDLLLNRCLYGAFLGAPADARTRLDWLARQEPARWGEDFWPQPYEQLAAVLADMGHDEDARRVLVTKEHLQRRARRARAGSSFVRALLWAKDALLLVTIGYGRQPLRAFAWIALFWAVGALVFGTVHANDAMRPNVPVFVRSPEWVLCAVTPTESRFLPSAGAERPGLARPGQSQLACFRSQPEAASYPRFNPWMYSLDSIIPGIELGQGEHWVPDTRSDIGFAGRAFLYFQTIIGWALSLLAVAGFSGIVRTR